MDTEQKTAGDGPVRHLLVADEKTAFELSCDMTNAPVLSSVSERGKLSGRPREEDNYFSHEQVTTWGVDQSWDLPDRVPSQSGTTWWV
ncbi:hypothetical protein ABZS76_27500 [Streptomyces sp. NPDC005562]|uniref:hypothetical protein n=1 Tax=Streptomyces sp. NPDC005562 TaxID=3154890 RepID=UPI0033B874E7